MVCMMKRTKEIKVRLSDEEFEKLNQDVLESGLSREEYVRLLLRKVVPSSKPSPDFIETIKQLRMIGNNLNQIAVIAYKTKSIDVVRYKKEMLLLQNEIKHILDLYNEPIRLEER